MADASEGARRGGDRHGGVEGDADPWGDLEGRDLVFLLDTNNFIERQLIKSWIKRNRPAGLAREKVHTLPIRRARMNRMGELDPRFEACVSNGGDPMLAPLRLVWIPEEEGSDKKPSVSELMRLASPRLPTLARQLVVGGHGHEAARVVAAEAAPLSELRERWKAAVGAHATKENDFAEFVGRQATLSLEVAERRIRGPRYKVPKLVREEIENTVVFRNGMQDLAKELNRSVESVTSEAEAGLKEIAAGHNPQVIDAMAAFSKLLYTQAYEDKILYDHEQLKEIGQLGRKYPLIFLPTHKSYMDHLVLRWAMHETGLAPNHVAAGVNLSFFPMGTIFRRAGMFFIRRSFQNDPIYKFVLRRYIDYLVSKRFSLEWYIEGGRSRSGKLLPPRFGMLAYVVDAYMRGCADDVILVPTSIVYDQLHDVSSYASEASGAKKKAEDLGFMFRYIRGLRDRFGCVSIRFGEPVSIREQLGPPQSGDESRSDEKHIDLKKVAFEVAVRINKATPISPISLVTMAMLGVRGQALSVQDIVDRLQPLAKYAENHKLPLTEPIDLHDTNAIAATLQALMHHKVVDCYSGGPEPVYQIGPERAVAAAYYRNAIIHFFLNGSIAELALARARQAPEAEPNKNGKSRKAPRSVVGVFWDEVFELRDLLKFEFFFSEKNLYREEIRKELSPYDRNWEASLEKGPAAADALLNKIVPYNAHRVLRAFVESYKVAADVIAGTDVPDPDQDAVVQGAIGLGNQYLRQRRIMSPESISALTFANALELARNRALVGPDERPEISPEISPEIATERREFVMQLRGIIRRLDLIQGLAESRFAER